MNKLIHFLGRPWVGIPILSAALLVILYVIITLIKRFG